MLGVLGLVDAVDPRCFLTIFIFLTPLFCLLGVKKWLILLALGTMIFDTLGCTVAHTTVAAGKGSDQAMTLPLVMLRGVGSRVVPSSSLLGIVIFVAILTFEQKTFFWHKIQL